MTAGWGLKMIVAGAVLTQWASKKHLRPLLVKLKAKWFPEEEAKLWIREEAGVLICHLVKSWRKDAMQSAPATCRPCPWNKGSLARRNIDIGFLIDLRYYLRTAETVGMNCELSR